MKYHVLLEVILNNSDASEEEIDEALSNLGGKQTNKHLMPGMQFRETPH